jgi:hypothetical protein
MTDAGQTTSIPPTTGKCRLRLLSDATWERRRAAATIYSVVVVWLALLQPATGCPAAVLAKPPASKSAAGQTTRKKPPSPRKSPARPIDQLAKLRAEFIKATKDYKASLERLRESYEKSKARADSELAKSKELFAAGLISKKAVEAAEAEVSQQKEKVAEVDRRMAGADSQIADTLLEAEAESKLARSKPVPKGGLVRTAAYIRYNGGAVWGLSDAWKVQSFFLGAFKRPLPVAVFGQGSIHDRWRLDHHNAMDVSLHPDGAEGQALLGFLRANGIPFLAFREAIPGTATGPHIHIGRPSHRY